MALCYADCILTLMLFIYFHKLSRSISDHHLRCEKHPIVEFSCNVKTARLHLKTDTIAAIEKKKKKKKKKNVAQSTGKCT